MTTSRHVLQAWTLILGLATTHCSAARQGTCGSNTASSALNSRDLSGRESGLLGGFIALADGKTCTVILDVTRIDPSTGRYFFTAWTGNHCSPSVDPSASTMTLAIFGNGGYYKVSAFSNEELSYATLYSELGPSGGFQAVNHGLRRYFWDRSEDENGLQGDCRANQELGSFCATISDSAVWDLVVRDQAGPPIDPQLKAVFEQALTKRDKVRSSLANSSGLAKQAHDFSKDVIEYQRNRIHLSLAAMADLWLICSAESAQSAFKADVLRRQNINASGPSTPAAAGTPGWDVVAVGSSKRDTYSAEAILKACPDTAKVPEILKDVRLFDRSRSFWDELSAKQLIAPGDKPAPNVALYAASLYVIDREKSLRQRLVQQWQRLAERLLSANKDSFVFVHTNASLNGSSRQGSAPEDYRYAMFSLKNERFQAVRTTATPTGFLFSSAQHSKSSFDPGNSGSVFSLNGQVPLLTLAAADGAITSGGIAALPLPRGSSTSSQNDGGILSTDTESTADDPLASDSGTVTRDQGTGPSDRGQGSDSNSWAGASSDVSGEPPSSAAGLSDAGCS